MTIFFKLWQKIISLFKSVPFFTTSSQKNLQDHLIVRVNYELEKTLTQFSLLFVVLQKLNTVTDFQAFQKSIQAIFTDIYECHQYSLFLLHPTQNYFELCISKNILVPNNEPLTVSSSVSSGLVSLFLKRNEPLFLHEFGRLEDLDLNGFEVFLQGTVCLLPIKIQNTLYGFVIITRALNQPFDPDDKQCLISMSAQFSVVYDRCRLYEKLSDLAMTDELTDVFNRRYFQKFIDMEFKRAKRLKTNFSILLIDVDHFKMLNDKYGHLAGDVILKTLVNIIQQNTREIDLLARFGGEEFVLLLLNTDLDVAQKVAEKLQNVIRQNQQLFQVLPHTHSQEKISLTVSIGVSAYPQSAQEPADLIHAADEALYAAKNQGRDCVVLYKG